MALESEWALDSVCGILRKGTVSLSMLFSACFSFPF